VRAAHHRFDRPLVLDDALAVRLIGAAAARALDADRARFDTPPARALRAAVVLRNRYAEDVLADVARCGVRQYVMLGAGLDTFAYGRAAIPGLRMFEADAAPTQIWKRACLARAGIVPPPALAYVPVDFEQEPFPAALARAGFERQAPALFSWLG
jgi:methyltransferase (TIGR00027 family)